MVRYHSLHSGMGNIFPGLTFPRWLQVPVRELPSPLLSPYPRPYQTPLSHRNEPLIEDDRTGTRGSKKQNLTKRSQFWLRRLRSQQQAIWHAAQPLPYQRLRAELQVPPPLPCLHRSHAQSLMPLRPFGLILDLENT